ncbi:probable methyltransferase PMT16 isoform X2 [Mercurialis annua]|uniref:probable methyltransferase PMT16 isoform X2 n=1 Tax=Mercurialis annua TaxID=3986 RepID=UPI00215F2C83|nr:probable methyltransferase PMT16 isoform X2 [Mercurialis annua]
MPPIISPASFLALKTKKANLYKITVTTILCTIFYLIGFYQNSRGRVPVSASHASIFDCAEPVFNATLDFNPHHVLPDPPLKEARAYHLPPCDSELSEYTPCEDRNRSLKFDRDRLVYRERHCPEEKEVLKCRVPAPFGYRVPFRWPESREYGWFANVPHKELTVEKKNQNWVRYEGDRFRFPGGGTMFPRGADAYIDDIGKLINLSDGSIRTAIDTGCGVASFGAYLLSRNIITMSFAPRDTHEAQVQFALERGVPALIGVFASMRQPYPARAFDMAHCSRCLIPWDKDDQYLIEVDRMLRPGGYWVLSGPPINWENHWKGWDRTTEDLNEEQTKIETIAKSLCWKKLIQKGDIAIWQKPTNHIHCKANRKVYKEPLFCQAQQDPDMAWYTKMETCMTPLPEVSNLRDIAGGELANWPERLTAVPPRISSGSVKEITSEIFTENTNLWKKRVAHYKSVDYKLAERGRFRNILDMNAYLGGFAGALVDDPAWVMNVVPVEAEINTLGVIYERGLIGTYQNWCEAMSTYPRTYDLIHADSVFSLYTDRCQMEDIVLEMDRVPRPEGSVIIRDDVDILLKVKSIVDVMQWDARIADHERSPHVREKILFAVKQYWTAPPSEEQESTIHL